jgi:hypothetical protein
MIAYDSRSGPLGPTLSAETIAQLRAAIMQQWQAPESDDAGLRAALAAATAEARSRHVRPEQLILALKEILADIGRALPPLLPAEDLRRRERLITTCIEMYFTQR